MSQFELPEGFQVKPLHPRKEEMKFAEWVNQLFGEVSRQWGVPRDLMMQPPPEGIKDE